MNSIEFETARFKAIKYIGISKKTIFEVKKNLEKKQFDDETIEKVIDYLLDLGYLSDEDYIDSYIRQNERMLKYSIYELKEKLKIKGIKSNIFEQKFSILRDSGYERKVIDKITKVKSKNLDSIQIKQYLYRRGFNWNGDN
ncbi:MAG: regulatory protein RecX [Clostridia bacterium]